MFWRREKQGILKSTLKFSVAPFIPFLTNFRINEGIQAHTQSYSSISRQIDLDCLFKSIRITHEYEMSFTPTAPLCDWGFHPQQKYARFTKKSSATALRHAAASEEKPKRGFEALLAQTASSATTYNL